MKLWVSCGLIALWLSWPLVTTDRRSWRVVSRWAKRWGSSDCCFAAKPGPASFSMYPAELENIQLKSPRIFPAIPLPKTRELIGSSDCCSAKSLSFSMSESVRGTHAPINRSIQILLCFCSSVNTKAGELLPQSLSTSRTFMDCSTPARCHRRVFESIVVCAGTTYQTWSLPFTFIRPKHKSWPLLVEPIKKYQK